MKQSPVCRESRAKAALPAEIPGVRLALNFSLSTALAIVQTTTEDFT
jgi:hypothetical protein